MLFRSHLRYLCRTRKPCPGAQVRATSRAHAVRENLTRRLLVGQVRATSRAFAAREIFARRSSTADFPRPCRARKPCPRPSPPVRPCASCLPRPCRTRKPCPRPSPASVAVGRGARLSFLLRILFGAGRQGAFAAPKIIRSKNNRRAPKGHSAQPDIFWRTHHTKPDPKLMRMMPLCLWGV